MTQGCIHGEMLCPLQNFAMSKVESFCVVPFLPMYICETKNIERAKGILQEL